MVRPDTPYLSLAELSRAWAGETGEPRVEVFRLILGALWRGEFETEDADVPLYLPAKPAPLRRDADDPEDVDAKGYARVAGRTETERCTRRDLLARLCWEGAPMLRDLPDGGLGGFAPDSSTGALFHECRCCPLINQGGAQPLEADWDALARIDWLHPEWDIWRRELFDPIALPRRTFGNWCDAVGFVLPRFWFPRGRAELRALNGRKQATAAAMGRCRRWLEGLMRTGPPTQSKGDYEAEAVRVFGISKTAFRGAWRAMSKKVGNRAWWTPGRKRKS